MADDALDSAHWHRIRALHPQLGGHVRIVPQPSRDARWYLLVDHASGRQHRLNDIAYQFVGRCDGQHSVEAIWASLFEPLGEQTPTQDELVGLLGTLVAAGLLQVEKPSDVEALFEQNTERRKAARRSALNPLAFRIQLFDPTPWLMRLDGLGQALFRPWALMVWLAAMALALIATGVHWDALHSHAALNMLTPRYLLLLWLCYPFIKALHELAHGLAVRRWGGEVTQMGVSLLLLIPAPYVDASAASAFRPRYQRVMVSAVGIMTELSIAALALLVWLNIEAGLLRDIAFVLMFTGSVSTLLFNGNPLLRFDGYYVLTDALNLPNLALRSRRYWIYLAQRYLLRLPVNSALQPGRGERFWLVIYAPLSWVYRIAISLLITFWIATKSFFLALAAGAYLLYLNLAQPLYRILRFAFVAPLPGGRQMQTRILAGAALAMSLIVLTLLPMPSGTTAEGMVWLPEQAQLRAGTDGFVVRMAVRDGEAVVAGQVIGQLEDPALTARQRDLQSQHDAARTRYFESALRNPLQAQEAAEAMQKTAAELERINAQIARLEVRSEIAGTLVMPKQADMQGVYMKRGELLGFVFRPDQVRVRTVVQERDVAQIRTHARQIRVLLAENPGQPLAARLTRQTPAATHILPSAALGDRAGGHQRTDPSDPEGVQTAEPVFLVDLRLDRDATRRVGGRAWVQFEHAPEPLATQWSRRLQQTFLKHFSPTA